MFHFGFHFPGGLYFDSICFAQMFAEAQKKSCLNLPPSSTFNQAFSD